MSLIQFRPENAAGDEALAWLEMVRQQVGSLHYGVVQVIVHDSRVIQIERTERVRLEPARAQHFGTGRKAGA
jgi:hypothetical protein